MAKFADIPKFVGNGTYCITVGLEALPSIYAMYVERYGLDVNPDFQRGHVWNQDQKIRFVEYMLRGGTSGLDIYINCPTWVSGDVDRSNPNTWMVLVDGKQRLDAVLGFRNNEFPVFGSLYREYTDHPRLHHSSFRWWVNNLATREECLQWYLDLNSGGTPHTADEIARVRDLLHKKEAYVRPDIETLRSSARFDREVLQPAIREMAKDAQVRDEYQAAKAAGTLPPEPKIKTRKTTRRWP